MAFFFSLISFAKFSKENHSVQDFKLLLCCLVVGENHLWLALAKPPILTTLFIVYVIEGGGCQNQSPSSIWRSTIWGKPPILTPSFILIFPSICLSKYLWCDGGTHGAQSNNWHAHHLTLSTRSDCVILAPLLCTLWKPPRYYCRDEMYSGLHQGQIKMLTATMMFAPCLPGSLFCHSTNLFATFGNALNLNLL